MILSTPFDVTVHPNRTAVRVAPRGELDVATCRLLATQLDELWESGWTEIVVDMRELTFMDSSGVHLLVEHHRRASKNGARLAIIDGEPCVAKTLRLCGVYDMFDQVHPQPAA